MLRTIALVLALLACLSAGAPAPAVKTTPEHVPTAIALTEAAKKVEMKANQTSVENLKCKKGLLDLDDWDPPPRKGGKCDTPAPSAACCQAAGATVCCTKHAKLMGYRFLECGCA